jgi:hypothetical protein
MKGQGFKHIDKDNFLVVDSGYDIKNLRVKLLKKDMQKALREAGLNDSGKKPEVLAKFIQLTKNLSQPTPVAKAKAKSKAKPQAQPTPPPKAETKPVEFIPLEEAVPQFKSKNIKIKKLPPLKSKREDTLEVMKVAVLKQILKDKGLKFLGNKEKLIRTILESENIPKGVDWNEKMYLTDKLYEDLIMQHYYYKNLNRFEKELSKLDKTDPRFKVKKEYFRNQIEEGNAILSRDLQKEYETELARHPVVKPKAKAKPTPPPSVETKVEKKDIRQNFLSKNPFYLLGLEETATDNEVEENYKELKRRFIPSLKHSNESANKKLDKAYEDIKEIRQIQKPMTEDQFVEEFDTPYASTALFQHNQKSYEALEKLIEKQVKKDGFIDIDLLLSKGVQIPISTVKKLVMKYGLIKTFNYTIDLLKSINRNIKVVYADELTTNFNKSRTFKILNLSQPAEPAKAKPKPSLKPPSVRPKQTETKGKGFFKHNEKDFFTVEDQGEKDIKNVKVKVLKADMQKAIKESGLPLNYTGKKDVVLKNFIRLANARTIPLSQFKRKVKVKKPTNRLEALPDVLQMYINKFVMGNPTAKLIKKTEQKLKKIDPRSIINPNANPYHYPFNPYEDMELAEAYDFIDTLNWSTERQMLEEDYVQDQFRQRQFQTILTNRSIINPNTNPNRYPYNPYADFGSYEEAYNFIESLPWSRERIDDELTYLESREEDFN